MGDIPHLSAQLLPTFPQLVGVAVVRGGVVSPLRVVTTCCSVFWMPVEEFLEQLWNDTVS